MCRRDEGYPAGDERPASERPAVFVLPGILGSHLAVDGKRVWLSMRVLGGLGKLAYQANANNVQADGPIGMVYDDLIDYLADSHEVIPFGFDWRRPIEEEARRLGMARLHADASTTARGFFQKRGFKILKQAEVDSRGPSFASVRMAKPLA